MDALDFTRQPGGPGAQYSSQCCEREVGKAWAAFSAPDVPGGEPTPDAADMIARSSVAADPEEQKRREEVRADRLGIASGNWGCGVFGGDKFLKALLQAIAATLADRPLLQYYTYVTRSQRVF